MKKGTLTLFLLLAISIPLSAQSVSYTHLRQEADRLRAIFMAGHPNFDLLYRGQPDTYFVTAQRYSAINPPAVKEACLLYTSDISWKKLVYYNDLQRDYTLMEGDIIYLKSKKKKRCV